MAETATREFLHNLHELPHTVKDACFRLGKAPESEREESQATFHNLFLHIHSVRVHVRTLKPTLTFGLGLMATASFVITIITGVLLMVYYKPSTDLAYQSIKDIHFTVSTGRFIRNIHRWSAQLMVLVVLLHMARVFFTASYKKPREFNWLVGLGLLVITLALSFTGYLLPWDQLAYWAITIGSNIANSPRELTDAIGITKFFDPGGFQKRLLLGANYVGQDALIRFYVLHVFVLPLALVTLLGVHFWRIRKDGGLARPEDPMGGIAEWGGERRPVFQPLATKTYGLMALVKGKRPPVNRGPENTVMSWPHLFWAELSVFMVTVASDAHPFLLLGRATEGTRQSRNSREPRESPLVLPGDSGAGFVLGVHGRPVDPSDRGGWTGADSVPGPPRRRRGHMVRDQERAAHFLAILFLCLGRHRRHAGIYGQLRLVAQLVPQHSPAVDYRHQPRFAPGADFRGLVTLCPQAQGLGALGSGLIIHVLSGRLHHFDLLRDSPSRA